MPWDWQSIETAPTLRLVLIAIATETPDAGYVAQAVKMPSGQWRLFGQGEVREGETITHWIEPELPEVYSADIHDGLADNLATRNFPPVELDQSNVPMTPLEPPASDDSIPPPLVNQLEPAPPLVNELEQK